MRQGKARDAILFHSFTLIHPPIPASIVSMQLSGAAAATVYSSRSTASEGEGKKCVMLRCSMRSSTVVAVG